MRTKNTIWTLYYLRLPSIYVELLVAGLGVLTLYDGELHVITKVIHGK